MLALCLTYLLTSYGLRTGSSTAQFNATQALWESMANFGKPVVPLVVTTQAGVSLATFSSSKRIQSSSPCRKSSSQELKPSGVLLDSANTRMLVSGMSKDWATVCTVESKSGAVMIRLVFEVDIKLDNSSSLYPGFDPTKTPPAPMTARKMRG